MSRRKDRKLAGILSIFLLFVLIMLIVSINRSCSHVSENNPSDLTTGPIMSQTTTMASSALELQPLAIDFGQPCYDSQTGLDCWPAASCIESIHLANLSQYSGRSETDKPLAGILVILDPGHGGQDYGTYYPLKAAAPEIIEKEINLAVAFKTRSALEDLGATVIMTRESDEWVSLYKRIGLTGQIVLDQLVAELPAAGRTDSGVAHLPALLNQVIQINSDAADSGGRGMFQGSGTSEDQRLLMDLERQYADVLFISLHCNALENDANCRGLQVFYESNEKVAAVEKEQYTQASRQCYTYYDDESRLRLAQTIHDAVIGQLPDLKYSGEHAVIDGDYAILRESNLTSVLVEMGFVTNTSDRQTLKSDANQQQIADALAQGVFRYFCQ